MLDTLLVRDVLGREGLRLRSGHAASLARRVRGIAGPTHLQVEVEPLLEPLTPLEPLITALDPALLNVTPE